MFLGFLMMQSYMCWVGCRTDESIISHQAVTIYRSNSGFWITESREGSTKVRFKDIDDEREALQRAEELRDQDY